jgi:hypothetical protein
MTAEILALRHQLNVLERKLHGQILFAPADRALAGRPAAPTPRHVLRHIRLLVRPETAYAGTAT